MQKSIFIIMVLLIGIFSACENTSPKQSPAKQEAHDHGHDDHEGHDHSNDEATEEESHDSRAALVLDNGKKWTANPETTEGVNLILKSMHAFKKLDDTKAFAELKKKIDTDFNMIFEKCTMTGEAHNQLHNFLHPMLEMKDGLSSKDIKVCRDSYIQLINHLNTYKNYFE